MIALIHFGENFGSNYLMAENSCWKIYSVIPVSNSMCASSAPSFFTFDFCQSLKLTERRTDVDEKHKS